MATLVYGLKKNPSLRCYCCCSNNILDAQMAQNKLDKRLRSFNGIYPITQYTYGKCNYSKMKAIKESS